LYDKFDADFQMPEEKKDAPLDDVAPFW
jgi:hypothetical protein